MNSFGIISKTMILDVGNSRTQSLVLYDRSLDYYELNIKFVNDSLLFDISDNYKVSFILDDIQYNSTFVDIVNTRLGQIKISLNSQMLYTNVNTNHSMILLLANEVNSFRLPISIHIDRGLDPQQINSSGCDCHPRPGPGPCPPMPPTPPRPVPPEPQDAKDTLITVNSYDELLKYSVKSVDGRIVRLNADVSKFKSLCLDKTDSNNIIVSQLISNDFTYYVNNYFYCFVQIPENENCIVRISLVGNGSTLKESYPFEVTGGSWVPIFYSYSIKSDISIGDLTLQISIEDVDSNNRFSTVKLSCVTNYINEKSVKNIIKNGNFDFNLDYWLIGGSSSHFFDKSYLSQSQLLEFNDLNNYWKCVSSAEIFPDSQASASEEVVKQVVNEVVTEEFKKRTTLADYGITDAYTIEQVDSMLDTDDPDSKLNTAVSIAINNDFNNVILNGGTSNGK